jgi:hypothetical protein
MSYVSGLSMTGLRCSIRLFSLFCFAFCVLFRLFFLLALCCHADREGADLSLVFARACGVGLVSIFLAWRVLVCCA